MDLDFNTVDRTVAGKTTFAEAEQDMRTFWHSRTPEDRMRYVEKLRQLNWGYDDTHPLRLQRVSGRTERP